MEQGPAALCGRTVFCLYPHQSAYVVPAAAVTVVPDGVPPARAVLAGTVETAVNALWDAAPLIGDRVTVVGAGMVGCCVARLLSRFPAIELTLVDVDPSRAGVAATLGAEFALPAGARGGRDLVVHASATSAGLQLSLDLLAPGADGPRPQLVRRSRGPTVARWGVSLSAPADPLEPGRDGSPARSGSRTRPTGWRSPSSYCATPPLTRSSPVGRVSPSFPP